MIEIKNLYKHFGKNEVLKGIDLSFADHGIYAVLGPNSSGKTTLIKSILGMVRPQKGKILVEGIDVKGDCEYRSKIGYLPQIARFPENLKVSELLDMIKDLRPGKTSADPIIDLFELAPFMDKKLGLLSGGTRQKVNIVQTFMFDHPILFLDEPTAGLDPLSIIKLKKLMLEAKKAGKLILITTHIMSFVEQMADQVIYLLEGKVHYEGSPEDLKKLHRASNLETAMATMIDGQLTSKPKEAHQKSDYEKIELAQNS